MLINEDYLDKVSDDAMSDDTKAVDAEFDTVLSSDEWYKKVIADGYDTLIVLGTESSASEEITDETRLEIIKNIKNRMQRIIDNVCEHSPIQVVYSGYDAELEEQLLKQGIVYELPVDQGGILPYDNTNYADQIFYKVCIKRTTIARLLDLVGSFQSILHLSKGDSDYEFVYLYRYENNHFIVIEDTSSEGGIRNWMTSTIENCRLRVYRSVARVTSIEVNTKSIADDLYTVGVFRELGLNEIQKQVESWIRNKIKAKRYSLK